MNITIQNYGIFNYTGKVVDNILDGQGTAVFYNGDKYEGMFKDNQFNGLGKITFKGQYQFVGEFQNSIKTGEGFYQYPNSVKLVHHFDNDMPLNEAEVQWINGSVFRVFDLKEWKGEFVSADRKNVNGGYLKMSKTCDDDSILTIFSGYKYYITNSGNVK